MRERTVWRLGITEASLLLAYDTARTIEAATALHARAGRSNAFIKIPDTAEGLPAITECIASGVPVNVTLLFSANHYRATADAYLTGVERRADRGLDAAVGSVASVFMSRWDAAVSGEVTQEPRDRLSLAVGQDTYPAYRSLMDPDRVQRLGNAGARIQRLLWASTRPKDPDASDPRTGSGPRSSESLRTRALSTPPTPESRPTSCAPTWPLTGLYPLTVSSPRLSPSQPALTRTRPVPRPRWSTGSAPTCASTPPPPLSRSTAAAAWASTQHTLGQSWPRRPPRQQRLSSGAASYAPCSRAGRLRRGIEAEAERPSDLPQGIPAPAAAGRTGHG
ncbi:transaldolase family protein [Streptomyces sp. NEAU-YJ-81]|uniref:transaldolase family protein n=1 Tax=Streptomyces sp. NEAU-YJ-81 TaxID=2820288 RepID=UPI0035ADE0B0